MGCFVAFYYSFNALIGTKFAIAFVQSAYGKLCCSNKSPVAFQPICPSQGAVTLPQSTQADRLFVIWYFTHGNQ
jgi:hypothetical protein